MCIIWIRAKGCVMDFEVKLTGDKMVRKFKDKEGNIFEDIYRFDKSGKRVELMNGLPIYEQIQDKSVVVDEVLVNAIRYNDIITVWKWIKMEREYDLV